MSLVRCLRASFLLLICSLAFATINAHACSATAQDVLFVGNTTTDSACNYNTIQGAINAATCSTGTRIYVTRELSYTAQHLSISNKNITLIGSAPSAHCGGLSVVCGILFPCPTNPFETISGSGHSGDSVITIRGSSNVTLQYLTISDGHDSDSGSGGGVDYDGTGILTIDTSTVTGNTAGYGGGINIKGSGGAAELHINHRTLITDNIAKTSGGGIRVEGNASLFMLADFTWVYNNTAMGGFGGGVEIVGPASGYIGSPGYSGIPVIYENQAKHGGGISVNAGNTGSLEDATLDLFSTDPELPVRISNNTATATGGGIYVEPYVSSTIENDMGFASVCASNFRIDNNLAKEGTAIYSDEENATLSGARGGQVNLNGAQCGSLSRASLGAVACTRGIECNVIDANIAADVSTIPLTSTTGATILMQTESDLATDRLVLRDNVGGYVLRVLGNRLASINRTLIVNNQVSQDLIWHQYDSLGLNEVMTIDNTTIANNQIGGYVIRDQLALNMFRTIIDQPDADTILFTGNTSNLNVSYVLADDAIGFPADVTNRIGQPNFIDAAHGDYRLRYSRQGGAVTASLGLDFAPAIDGDDSDIRNLKYDQDLTAQPNVYGMRDLGVYEMQPYTDRIFFDGFGDAVLLAY